MRVRLAAILALLAAMAGSAGARAAPVLPPAAAAPPAVPLPRAIPPIPPLVPVTVTLDRLAAGRPVPARFLGLSFEVAALGQLGSYAHRGNLVRLLRSLGSGVLRFGGVTADQSVAWSDALTPPPAWAASTIGPAQMTALGQLARRSGWQVLLTVGLAHYEPLAAAREVAAARAALGPYLAGVEIGNEPDAYGKHGFRELPWLVQGYQEEVGAYREAIDRLAPGVPLAGPDVSGSGVFTYWGYAEALAQLPALLTGHHYPLGCAQQPPPSIASLLSAATRGREARSLATYMGVAAAQALPLRLDEANSVSCGGVAGISNTFASALWSAGYIGQAMAAGTAGVNFHGHPNSCTGYSPICAPDPAAAASGELRAQPDWYGLLLTRTLPGFRPLPTALSSPSAPNLAVTGFLGPRGAVKLLLCDQEPPGSPPLAVSLPVGAGMGDALLERLTGPAPGATGGVLLAGRAIGPDGSWRPARGERSAPRNGVLQIRLAPSSAALLTVQPRPPRRGHRRR